MEVATESPPSTSQQKSKLGTCEVCTVKDAKYTCPRCEVKTCCLRCAAIHKREVECSGERDRTKFIRFEKFSNLDMSSDYQLLEEIGRSVANYKKGLKRQNPREHLLPAPLFRLQKTALTRNIYLKYLPAQFQRRKANLTRLQYKENVIYWMLEFVFLNADCLRLSEGLVSETTDIQSVLEKLFNKPEYSEKLKPYLEVGLHGARYFLKAEQTSGNQFYEIDISKSVSKCLYGKIIIEYPIIHVVLNGFADTVVIKEETIFDEKSVKMEFENDQNVNNNDPDEIYTSMKNLLFINDDI